MLLLKDQFLKKVMIVVVVAAVAAVGIGSYVVYPNFSRQIVKNTENESVLTAKHLANMIFFGKEKVEQLSSRQLNIINATFEDFDFFKVRIFSSEGEVIFSTEPTDVGSTNSENYFLKELAQGKVLTNIIRRNSVSREGEFVENDLVETYVPVMRQGRFIGALELYYDVSEKIKNLRRTLIVFNCLMIGLVAVYLAVIMIILIRLDKSISERTKINQELKESNASLKKSKKQIENKSNNLQDAFNKIAELTKKVSTSQDINIRYLNPKLVKCYEVKNCKQHDCPCHNKEAMRCWQVAGTYCGGSVQGNYAQKYIDCMECDVHRMAAPDHVEMIGEHFNNMMHILEMKHHQLEQAISDLKNMQNQLVQAEKMASMGTMAGGIAHEFNNILGAILGYADLAKEESPDNEQVREDLDQVLAAGNRAKDLVKQILAFSRQDERKFSPVKIDLIIEEAIKFLKTSIPSTIEIKENMHRECKLVMADPTQIHQLLMNLCTNAVHAMNEKGVITISLIEVDPSKERQAARFGVCSGMCVKLTVSDTGRGIEKGVQSRIFDPFFTTKGIGQGTGMGLSVVHGIVENHAGKVIVESEEGKGASFHVYLPTTNIELEQHEDIEEVIPTGNASILYVDDEMMLAHMSKQILERLGYQVTARTSSVEAIEAFRNQPDRFDLIITDQTMPNISGIELVERVKKIREDIPIILCTGFSSIVNEKHAEAIGIDAFIMKPVEKMMLARTVRNVLDGIKQWDN